MKISNTPALRRMPTYLHRLFRLRLSGQEWVSCAELAQYMNIPHIVVRKDIAMTALPGNKRHGFRVNELINAILHLIGWDQATAEQVLWEQHCWDLMIFSLITSGSSRFLIHLPTKSAVSSTDMKFLIWQISAAG